MMDAMCNQVRLSNCRPTLVLQAAVSQGVRTHVSMDAHTRTHVEKLEDVGGGGGLLFGGQILIIARLFSW